MNACAALTSGFGVLMALAASPAPAEEFSFDASEFEKKTFEFSGYVEQKIEALKLRGDSRAYKLAYPDQASRDSLLRATTTLEAASKLNLAPFVADLRVQASAARDALQNRNNEPAVIEAGLRWSASPGLTVDLGKRVQRWGKGYAWSPVGFVERPKDPADPTASREGFTMLSGEWTRSLAARPGAALGAVGLTGLVLPTNERMNADYGATPHLNPAARLYLLAYDTDVDLLWRGKGARPESLGVDFSRNISSALEVHGEWAHTFDATRKTVNATGVTRTQQLDVDSWLVGLRYLTAGEVTWIGEYYRNGSGYGTGELNDYYQFLDTALAADAAKSLAARALALAQSGYGKSNAGRDTLYVKASVSEPFNWVYGAASLTTMVNLNDRSFQLTPEISYTGFHDVELRVRAVFLSGGRHTEFGEKLSNRRLEAYARLYF